MSQQLPSITLKTSTAQMALSLLESGNYHQALQVFRQVPDSDRTLDDGVNQAVCLLHLDQPEAALQICNQTLELNATHPQAWLFKGVALYRLGRYDEAYACYAQAAAAGDPQPPQHLQRPWTRCWQALKTVTKRFS
jgi:tetratricopeptide (TPR) repeat protein